MEKMNEQKNIDAGDRVRIKGREGVGEVIKIEKRGEAIFYKILLNEKIIPLTSPPSIIEKVLSPLELAKNGEFDLSYKFDFLTDATRLSLAYEYDHLLSLSSTRTKLEYYQVDLVNYVLSAYKQRFLIADDVGLGKTIEAGMILKELACRNRGNRVLLIVPANMQSQWHREMKNRFDENFKIYNSNSIEVYRNDAEKGKNVWDINNKIITSLDYVKKDVIKTELERANDFEVIVFDEAHKLSASRYGNKIDRSDRYKFAEDIILDKNKADNLFLLTATPHKGDKFAFYSLINLLDPYLFKDENEVNTEKLDRVMIRRVKDEILGDDGKPLFKDRDVASLPISFTKSERELYEDITNYVIIWYNKAKQLKQRAVGFAMTILQKRMVSSIYAIKESLKRREKNLSEKLKLMEIISKLNKDELDKISKIEKEYAELEEDPDSKEDKEKEDLEKLIEVITLAETPEELNQEIKELKKLIKIAENIKVDSKANELKEFVKGLLKKSPKEKILIFTEYKDTLDYLLGIMKKVVEEDKICIIHGGMSMSEREEQEKKFNYGDTNILIGTDATSEGINLHYNCHLMINYDLPWNPNRIEQRIGRLHRYGQTREVKVWNLFIEQSKEDQILLRLLEKIKEIEKVYKGKMPNVIGTLLGEVKLNELIMNALAVDKEIEATVEKLDKAIEERKKAFETVQNTFLQPLRKFDLESARKITYKSLELSADDKDIENFVRAFFNYYDGKIENTKKGKEIYRLYPPKTVLNEGVEDKYEYATFSKQIASDDKYRNIEFIAFKHPLLESILNYCQDKDWSFGGRTTIKINKNDKEGILFNYKLNYTDNKGQSISEDFFSILIDKKGNAEKIDNIKTLIDYKDYEINKLKDTDFVKNCLKNIEDFEQKALDNAQKFTDQYVSKVKEKREREVKIRKEDAEKYFKIKIDEEDRRIKEFELKKQFGADMEVAIRSAKKRKEEHQNRLKNELEKLENELQIISETPQLLNLAFIIPYKEEFRDIKRKKVSIEEDKREEIGKEGERIVMEFERMQGRFPKDVSKEFKGYDIESEGKNEVRYIEVKSFVETGFLELSDKEWRMAEKLKDKYWIYIIEYVFDQNKRELHTIQNPSKCLSEEIKGRVKIVLPKWKEECGKSYKI